ncbi:MAG: mannose-1-phosphate guanylyltransferase [Legionella sp. 40-6]|nr:nucleotidyltransferase family protein [Legionella sp.]OJY54805.1 MAG: mannose-1-phosphate guanylyltransferase [Legionella sp. 40-6]
MKTAMILAAGRGERLKPLTRYKPKALCEIGGQSLIEHHIHNLVTAGFKRIIINHAYLGDQIRRKLGSGAAWNIDIFYSAEPPGGLETGGGIYQALPLLGAEPFLVVNADIYTDFNFTYFQNVNTETVHLILIPKNPLLNHCGDYGLEGNFLTNQPRHYVMAGITCYHPQIFTQSSVGRYSIVPLIRKLAYQRQVTGEVFTGKWHDIGTYARLQCATEAMTSVLPQ